MVRGRKEGTVARKVRSFVFPQSAFSEDTENDEKEVKEHKLVAHSCAERQRTTNTVSSVELLAMKECARWRTDAAGENL